ncbi:MAG: peptidylprolyl isomerase [Oscillibacter sp.]
MASYFAELADEYSEDPGRESHPTGYTFTTGSMVQEFEDAAYALSEGEVSEVVESSLGYHILLRLPLDKAAAADEVRDDYFTNFIAEQVDAAAMATSADYDKLDPQTIYEGDRRRAGGGLNRSAAHCTALAPARARVRGQPERAASFCVSAGALHFSLHRAEDKIKGRPLSRSPFIFRG